jgi:AraC family transcriptional regulator
VILKNLAIHSEARTVSKLFVSDFYEIKNWSLNFGDRSHFKTEYNDCFCLVFVRSGNLTKAGYDMHTGHAAIEKPDFEYQLLPSVGECTIINFTDEFYRSLTEEVNLSALFRTAQVDTSLIVNSSPESEYLLYIILERLRTRGKLEIDGLVVDFLNQTLMTTPAPFSSPLSAYHCSVIANGKEYIRRNFMRNLSLYELSRHCGISPFYLSRLFKACTASSPHQYLLNIRLKHGEMLLRNTSQSVADISYSSGFTSPEYFSTLFKRKYRVTPTEYRSF